MRYQFSKSDQVAGGKIQGVKSRDAKTGIHSIPPGSPEHLENCRAGGLVTGPSQGAANVASGQWDRIRNSPVAVEGRLAWAQSDENKMRVREMGKKFGPDVDMDKVRTIAGCKKGAAVGGPIGRHIRHHFNRKLLNLVCPLCAAAKERHETWWTAIYIPNPNSNKAGKILPLSDKNF